ncbi:hypothetical protein [Streptomyces sp. NBC_01233]|uniref:hypothetical protein n=1 Tax=Streptomyces sp. NBC_01233 TaxID=2903787 RepID=UPI002E0FD25D|nr:hypothetical protein OG332_37510 [Streptomyces sp. NBC_01233]
MAGIPRSHTIKRRPNRTSAYVPPSENPTLPVADVLACARIAVLYMLFSFYGATTAEYDLPDEAEADLQRHWSERQTSIRRLIESLADLEDALATETARPGGLS